jgi:lysophospholipase L1-like esterase
MWQYARQIKVLSSVPGVIEEQRPDASARLMGVRVRTDSHGFRRPHDATEQARRPGRRVAVAVGDSMTFGWGVAEGQTFSDELERRLSGSCPAVGGRPVTVHNAGIGNSNTAMELARYRALIRPAFRPDWVILAFVFNDAEADPVPRKNPFLWRSALASFGYARFLRMSGSRLDDYRSYYVDLFREGRPGWVRAEEALRSFGALLEADRVPATLLLIPELHDPHDPGIAEAFSRVAAAGRQSGFEVIDSTPEFPSGPGARYWVSSEDAHPNAAAQALYSRALARSAFACFP